MSFFTPRLLCISSYGLPHDVLDLHDLRALHARSLGFVHKLVDRLRAANVSHQPRTVETRTLADHIGILDSSFLQPDNVLLDIIYVATGAWELFYRRL